MGINTIANMMKNLVKSSPLSENPKKITNHSVRKTVVRKLKCAGFQKVDTKNIIGHANEQGLDPYDEGNDDQLKAMSTVLAN